MSIPLSEGGEISEILFRFLALNKRGKERRTHYIGPPNVPTPTPNPFNTLPISNPPIPPGSSNCIPAPNTYSTAANSKQLLRPNFEQKGIPSGTPNNAPTSQEVMICACVDAKAEGDRAERPKWERKEGRTMMPPMKPTE
jgi:hypothetical protein